MALEPVEGFFEVAVPQMKDQVDGPAAAGAEGPVEETGSIEREHSLGGMPFTLVAGILQGVASLQHRFQGNGPQLRRAVLDLVEVHRGWGCSRLGLLGKKKLGAGPGGRGAADPIVSRFRFPGGL